MKFIKKAAALILCVSICASFVGCGGSGADPAEVYEKYTASEKKTNSLEKYSAELIMSVSADFGDGTDMAVNTNIDITADIASAVYSQKMTYEYPGYGSMDMSFYHADNTTYYSGSDGDYKYTEADEDAVASVSEVASFALPEAAFKNAEIKDGDTVAITATAKGEDMAEIAAQFLASIDSYLEVTEAIDYDVSDVEIELGITDGYLTLMSLEYSADFDYEGNAAKAEIAISISYTDISGNAVPSALDGYEDFPSYEDYLAEQQIQEELDDEMSGEAIDAAFALFEDDHRTKVENYDELYAEACDKYGKDMMDSIIEIIVMFGSVSK